jgi:hypothetical protein
MSHDSKPNETDLCHFEDFFVGRKTLRLALSGDSALRPGTGARSQTTSVRETPEIKNLVPLA